MSVVIAITGGKKIEVTPQLSQKQAAVIRRELMQSDEHFDMFGIPTCQFRIKRKK
jgi:hypothetical protein